MTIPLDATLMIDWQAISTECGPLVWRTARRLLRSEADAADCFQETFLAALVASRRQTVRNWPGLLQRIATTRALNALRSKRRDAQHRTAWDPDATAVRQITAEQKAQSDELVDRLREALTRLPEQHAEVFCLRELNQLSYEEIAREIGMTTDGVGVALHRARARLREELAWANGPDVKKVTHGQA